MDVADDWNNIKPEVTDPQGDALSLIDDLRSVYVTNDSDYLYFMLDSYGEKIAPVVALSVDKDLDGKADFKVWVKTEWSTGSKHIYLEEQLPGGGTNTKDWGTDVALGNVLEFKVKANIVGTNKFNIIKIELLNGDSTAVLDTCEELIEVNINTPSTPTSLSASSDAIPFPSTESLWRTTDGGKTWERIFTSGLNIYTHDKQMKIGHLASIALSANFAQDNTLFVFEPEGKYGYPLTAA